MKESVFTCTIILLAVAVAEPGRANRPWNDSQDFFEQGQKQLEQEIQILTNQGSQKSETQSPELLKLESLEGHKPFPILPLEVETQPNIWQRLFQPKLNTPKK